MCVGSLAELRNIDVGNYYVVRIYSKILRMYVV